MLRAVRRLFIRRSLRWPLLSSAPEARNDVELAPSVVLAVEEGALAKVEVLRGWWTECAIGLGLFFALLWPTVLIIYVVVDSWQNSPSQRSWLILGLGFYIVTALQVIYAAFVQVWERLSYLRVEIRRTLAATLFDAVSNALAVQAEQSADTCSRDTEAQQEHDAISGELSVRLRFWSSRPRVLRVTIAVGSESSGDIRHLALHVQYSPGEDIVCGRDAHLQSRSTLVLSIRTSPKRALDDKALLCKWLEESYKKWTRPVEGVVKIFALQESSSDWIPEWKFERVKPCKSVSGTGQSFYLERDSLQRILADAKLWAGLSLRVYMISGPPGVGKSEFVIWLASQLGLPIYRLCLSSGNLSDDRLAQLLSQSAISENAVLVQVDEFQETVQRWLRPSADVKAAVSPGGFCECVQGSTAMSRGVMVLSGTGQITSEEVQRQLAAVFRRIHCTAALTWMIEPDVRMYFRQFLLRFVPGSLEHEWDQWEEDFLQGGSPWRGLRPISIDMLKQFLMHQITDASCMGIGQFTVGSAPTFQVHPERRADFFKLICDGQSAESFLNAYAPVELTGEQLQVS